MGKDYFEFSGYALPNKPFLKDKTKGKLIDTERLDNGELESYISRIMILAD